MRDERWQDNLRAVAKTKGECPNAERLAKFLSGELAEEDSEKITRHVAACGVCDSLLERMRWFDDPEAWREVDNRLTERFHSFLGRQRRSVFSVLRHAWLAYLIVLLLIYPAYRGLVPAPAKNEASTAPASRVPGLESAKILQLDATRSEGVSAIAPTERDKVFILSFFLPIRTGLRYSAAIVDGFNKIIAAQPEISSYDGQGNFYLVCDRHVFTGGRYVLIVKESGGDSREFRFPFTL